MKKNLIFALGLSLITGFTACSSEIEDGTTDIDSWEMPYEEVVAKYSPLRHVQRGRLYTCEDNAR